MPPFPTWLPQFQAPTVQAPTVQAPTYDPFTKPFQFEMPDYETPAFDAYREYLGQIPSPADYQPSGLRRFIGGLAGAAEGWQKGPVAGYSTAEKIVRRPYDIALEDWSGRGAGLKEAANIEQAGLRSEIANLKNYMNAANQVERLRSEEYRKDAQISAWDRLTKAKYGPNWTVVGATENGFIRMDTRTGEKVAESVEKFYGPAQKDRASLQKAINVQSMITGRTLEEQKRLLEHMEDNPQFYERSNKGDLTKPNDIIKARDLALEELYLTRHEYRDYIKPVEDSNGNIKGWNYVPPSEGFLGFGATDMEKWTKFKDEVKTLTEKYLPSRTSAVPTVPRPRPTGTGKVNPPASSGIPGVTITRER